MSFTGGYFYNIRDWYWSVAGHAGVVWSTHDNAYVATTDARYLDFLSQGLEVATASSQADLCEIFNNYATNFTRVPREAPGDGALVNPTALYLDVNAAGTNRINLPFVMSPIGWPLCKPVFVSNALDASSLDVYAYDGTTLIATIPPVLEVVFFLVSNNDISGVGTWLVFFLPRGDVTNAALLSHGNLPFDRVSSFVDVDGTLAANLDTEIASQKAVKTYVDNGGMVSGIMQVQATVDFNTAGDTAITFVLPRNWTRYNVNFVGLAGASHSLTTATAGLFTGAGGTGVAIVSAGTLITVSATADATNNNSQTLAVNNGNTTTYTVTTLYFRVATPEGAAATATVTLNLRRM